MRRLLYSLAVLALFTQCQPEESYQTTAFKKETGEVKFGQEMLLQHREQLTLYGGNVPRRLIVTLDGLLDSRCPVDVNCVTAGNASIVLKASNSQGANDNINLCIGDCAGTTRETHTITAQVGEVSYRFTLKEVKPYPGTEKESEVQKARVVVEKI